MKKTYLAALALLPFALSACNGVGQMNVSGTVNETTTTTTTTSPISFAGLQSISGIAGTSMQLNWANVSGAASYAVYNMTSGSPVYVATVVAPTATYTVTGLSTSTSYTFRVKMTDTSGLVDTNTNNVSATTLSFIATFAGWSNAQALGAKTPVSQATQLSSAPAQVTLAWNAVTLNFGSVTSYNIYRATTSGGENYSSPLATGITTSALSYTDTSSLTSGTTYYYTIAPVVSGNVIPVTPYADSEISVIIPPANMALIHPWIANQDICGLMGRPTDRTNSYRCSYNGPGNVSGYYNMQTGLFVDTYGEGCNYTLDTTNCGVNGCLGTAATPCTGFAGTNGDVCYDRDLGTCYLRASGAWVAANSATSAQLALMMSNQPGLPPMVVIDQQQSWAACQSVSVSPYGAKLLLRHSQQIEAAAWSPSLSNAQISSLEDGTNLNTTFACNANSGSGYTFAASMPTGSNLDTLPGEGATGSIYSFVLGSLATANCTSRYGIQDMVGNVWQWSSDQLASCTNYVCDGITSPLDTSNTDWNGFDFDGGSPNGPGPGGMANTTGGTLSSETLGSATFNSFQIPLGLPMVGTYSSTWDGLMIGTGASGEFNPAGFHGNYFWLYADSAQGAARGAFAGGAWNASDGGRFALNLYGTPTVTYDSVGFRCALPAD